MITDRFLDQIKIAAEDLDKQGFCQFDQVFDNKSLKNLMLNFDQKRPQMRAAKVGKGYKKTEASNIRNDLMLWIEEQDPAIQPLWEVAHQIQNMARSQLFLPIKRFEAQMALYPPGHKYERHVDRHRNMPARLLSMVIYFNPWQPEDGGELVVYNDKNSSIRIPPSMNSAIVFDSALEHEVLPTKTERKSIAIWFREDIL